MTQPDEHVKEHLEKRGIDPASLPNDVIEKFNTFSKGELKKADDLGAALMDAGSVDNQMKISAVH
ncbi:MAG TPA: hypothetical protein VE055_01430 [Gaiellaceae bacterium]|nr:hypothetical protein [Gaiellaceae bacterium]